MISGEDRQEMKSTVVAVKEVAEGLFVVCGEGDVHLSLGDEQDLPAWQPRSR